VLYFGNMTYTFLQIFQYLWQDQVNLWGTVILEKLIVSQLVSKCPYLSYNPNVNYRVHNSPPLDLP
jgi:hypothetical protein